MLSRPLSTATHELLTQFGSIENECTLKNRKKYDPDHKLEFYLPKIPRWKVSGTFDSLLMPAHGRNFALIVSIEGNHAADRREQPETHLSPPIITFK